MFPKILIANRGEIAVRIIRACRDLGVVSVAVYSEADSDALHAQIADEAVCIGPGAAKDSYLSISGLIGAAKLSGAAAVHPGFGFLSESAEFAAACAKNGIHFIGPPIHALQQMGDKVQARKIAKKAHVPVTPGSDGAVKDFAEAQKIAGEIGFPLMLKAASGGGGKGIRRVERMEDLKKEYDLASREATASFGDGRIYVEKYVASPRHIEFQILADAHGHCVHLYERECSIQRRHQKLIEESPSPLLTPRLRKEMGAAAVRVAKACGYVGAGTVEFLVDSDCRYYFCEMNARIQVEHPVTETVCGIDLVAWQLKIASGESLTFTQKDIVPRGHAMECRINAEDAEHEFRPCPGTIHGMHTPGGPGVRVDSAAYQGYTIPPYYDSMISKLIVSGGDRPETLRRMRRALAEMLFEGVVTNTDFLMEILNTKEFEEGCYTTDFIEEYLRHRRREG